MKTNLRPDVVSDTALRAACAVNGVLRAHVLNRRKVARGRALDTLSLAVWCVVRITRRPLADCVPILAESEPEALYLLRRLAARRDRNDRALSHRLDEAIEIYRREIKQIEELTREAHPA